MRIALTAKRRLHTTLEQFQALRRTHLAYRLALIYVSRYAFAHSKMTNNLRLQKRGEKALGFSQGMNRPLLIDKHLF
jgi:hypothetical protein